MVFEFLTQRKEKKKKKSLKTVIKTECKEWRACTKLFLGKFNEDEEKNLQKNEQKLNLINKSKEGYNIGSLCQPSNIIRTAW